VYGPPTLCHGPPIVHASPKFVVHGADGCLVLAGYNLDLTSKRAYGPLVSVSAFLLFTSLAYHILGEAKSTLPTLVKNVMVVGSRLLCRGMCLHYGWWRY
jgi:hypothetical protein